MAINTKDTYLFYKAAIVDDYEIVCDIKSYPDVYAPPPKLQTTTLSDGQHTYVKDIIDVPDLVFGANFDEDDYDAIKLLEGNQYYYVLGFGEWDDTTQTFAVCGYYWQGDIFATPKGAGVGAVREMEITCYPSTDIEKDTPPVAP